MNAFERLDKLFMPEGYELTDLEKMARKYLNQSKIVMDIEPWNVRLSMEYQSKAIMIRNKPEWKAYRKT